MRPAAAATRFQVWSRPSSYDTYRGVVRAILDNDSPTANVANELPLEWYLRGVVPAEMPSSWPTEALEAQSIAARSFAARRLRPGESYYDVRDDTSSQVYRGTEAEKSSTNAAILATAGSRAAQRLDRSPTRCSTRPAAAPPSTTRTCTCPSTGAKVAGPVSYLRGSRDRRRDGTAYDSASPYADVVDDDLHAGRAVGHLRRRQPHRRRLADRAGPSGQGRVGPTHQGRADRVGGVEDRVGRRLPLGVQRRLGRPPTRCSGARCSTRSRCRRLPA